MVLILYFLLLISCSSESEPGKDIKNYRTEKIGDKLWMAENLNYDISGSKCYNNDPANCSKYGRLYDWETAMKACPNGWHIPSVAEWKALVDFVGGTSIAGRRLKATSGWHSCGKGSSYSYQCEDTYGFSAMPGGIGYSDGKFHDIGDYGYWWSAEYDDNNSYYQDLNYLSDAAGIYNYYKYGTKSNLLSVRCLKD
ncbi:MAG: fibrobacter succinogenes major paralogous domain-containing protein [Fibromonadales bacterium]|nr:fibrobacter succinogenes major paralogous domain-containing protein [Fibromonadales bacterium]